MNTVKENQHHKISLDMRKSMEINGVGEVISFDENIVLLKTSCGEISIEGSGIKINTLDTDRGIVALEGKIDAVIYSESDDGKHRGFFGKLLK